MTGRRLVGVLERVGAPRALGLAVSPRVLSNLPIYKGLRLRAPPTGRPTPTLQHSNTPICWSAAHPTKGTLR